MSSLFHLAIMLFIGVTSLLLAPATVDRIAPLPNETKEQDPRTPTSDDLFRTTRLLHLHLTIPAEEYQTMEPIGGMRFSGMPGGFGGLPGRPKKDSKPPTVKPGSTS